MAERPAFLQPLPALAGQPPLLRPLICGLWGLRRLVDILALALLCYMACAILVQITGRYVFNYSIAWSEETATFAQIWLTLLGAGIAMRSNAHVGVDVLIRKAPAPVQKVFAAGGLALGIWFMAAVIVGSMALVGIGLRISSPATGLPMAVPYLSLPVGFGYFLLEFALSGTSRLFSPEAAE